MRSEVIGDDARLSALGPEWTALWREVRASYRASFDFCRHAWTQVQRPGGARLACAVVRDDDGTLLLVLPLVVSRAGPVRMLRPLGVGTFDECQVVAREEGRDLPLREAWRRLTMTVGFDVAALSTAVGSAMHDLLDEHPHTRCVRRGVVPVAALSQEPDWDAYAATLGKLSGRKPGRVLRKLDTRGDVRRRRLDPARDDVTAVARWLVEQKRRWADAIDDDMGEWLESALFPRFLTAALQEAAQDSAPLSAFVVEVDDRVVAAVLAGVGPSSATGIFSAFDQDWAHLRVGAACWEYVMQWTRQEGLDFDFGYGGFRYKRFYSRGQHRVVDRLWTGHTVRGRLAVAALLRWQGLRAGWSTPALDDGTTGATAWSAYAEGRRHS